MRLAFCMMMCLALLSGPVTLAYADDSVDEKATEKKLSHVQKKIKALQTDIKRTQRNRSKTENALRKAELEIGGIKQSLRKTIRSSNNAQKTISGLRKQQKELQQDKRKQTTALLGDLTSAYQTGRQERLKLLLNQQQPEKLARILTYYDYFHKARLKRIDTFNQTLTEIDENKRTIQKELTALKQLRTKLETQRISLNTAQTERKKVIDVLSKKLQSSDFSLKKLKVNQNALRDLLTALRETLADLPPDIGKTLFAARKGKLRWPVKGKLLKRFGKSRGEGLKWNGVLLKTKSGTPVSAVHHGHVVFSDWLRGYGLMTIIDHGNGFHSLYGQSEALNKELGDWVEAGDIIAYSGNSGGQSTYGVYFELRHQGKPINPTRWCKR